MQFGRSGKLYATDPARQPSQDARNVQDAFCSHDAAGALLQLAAATPAGGRRPEKPMKRAHSPCHGDQEDSDDDFEEDQSEQELDDADDDLDEQYEHSGLPSYAPLVPQPDSVDRPGAYKKPRLGATGNLTASIASVHISHVADTAAASSDFKQWGSAEAAGDTAGTSSQAFAGSSQQQRQRVNMLLDSLRERGIKVLIFGKDITIDLKALLQHFAFGGYSTAHVCKVEGHSCVLKNPYEKVLDENVAKEVKRLKELQGHPNILYLVGVTRDDKVTRGKIAMVTMAMAGGALNTAINKYRIARFGEDVHVTPQMMSTDDWLLIASVALQILSGLKHFASMNRAHCDLKSANILTSKLKLDSTNTRVLKEPHVVVADVGTSRTLRDGVLSTTVKGTHRWMAPEILKVLHPLGPEKKPMGMGRWNHLADTMFTGKVDVWSLGVLLWELVEMMQSLPYGQDPDDTVFERIRDGQLTPAIPEGCPGELASMMTDCWSMDAEARPGFDELIQRMQQYRHGLLQQQAAAAAAPAVGPDAV